MSMELLSKAAAMAIRLHAGQLRKGTTIPYVAHPIEVAGIVLRHGGSEEEACAAFLHDVVEDCGGQPVLDEILASLGQGVADIVAACSDSVLPMGAEKEDWQPRKQRYLDHLAAERSRSVLIVSAADKLSNANAIVRDLLDPSVGAKVWSVFKAGRDAQLWYYGELSRTFSASLGGPLAFELAAAVAALHAEALRA